MELDVSFPGGKRVAVQVGKHLVMTDQPESLGGEDGAPAPFDLFLASIASCAGIYVLGFMQARNLPTEGLELHQHVDFDADTHLPTRMRIDLVLPQGFPEKYRSAVVRAAENCKVKKTMAAMPTIEVVATTPAAAA